ncbi:gag-polyprotein putative aspartyl protease [Phytophthora infestans]|uniref:Gag-polyprotein putative aspartyl protease n=1 Tax=Phytophthora infestans TaxID=4787 RepID=A0A833TCJ7_PHYIN|nr:gag-polyprotein putative aspartyl protease [Phytophthora infestans]
MPTKRRSKTLRLSWFEHLTIDAADFGGGTTEDDVSRFHQLLVKKGRVNGHAVKVLLDSGADHNVIRQGLAAEVGRRKKAVAERFDGTTTAPQWINEVKTDMQLEGYVLTNMLFSEWNLPATHDVILGKPRFSRFNPVINWRTHESWRKVKPPVARSATLMTCAG